MSMFSRLRRRRSAMRLSCAEVGALLQQYLDGELDGEQVEWVSAHLEVCRRCGLEASIYADLKHALAHRVTPPDDSVRRLREFGHRLAHGELPEEHP